jgi:prevent-host-death family protein
MRTVSAMSVRKRFGELLDAAASGERIVIERDRRPLAYLVSVEDGLRLDGPSPQVVAGRLAALDRLAALAADQTVQTAPGAAEEVRADRDRQ